MSAAVPFADGEELGSAWHGLIGTGDHELDGSLVEKKLKENPQFLRRVVATMGDGDDSIFFGPAKVLLSAVAKRLSAAATGGGAGPSSPANSSRRSERLSPDKRPAGPSRDDGEQGAEDDAGTLGGGITRKRQRN